MGVALGEEILRLSPRPTGWEGAVEERRSFVLRPVKVIAGGHAQHQSNHMVRPQDAPLQHHGRRKARCPQLDLKRMKDPV